ncbi:hypothetical protein [Umezawaea sp. Da 62-37]|uniref:hypothetical protein n=1 Tax=Umezawaea sp. Da 62-37 TaxID=3075927 RepID=UPI0028F6F7F4|nr:hypothetical protein [Umezawaea sp. Da 62-37]WNV86205.1 hypothetical protein RM788_50200 [Umezawaea sp. Da 62-37]
MPDLRGVGVRVAAWLAALLLLVVGMASIANAGADTGSDAWKPAVQPPVSGKALEHVDVVGGPSAQGVRETVSAVIDPTGAIAFGQSYEVTYANRIDVGTYEVFFGKDITKGTYAATIGVAALLAANESPPGLITVAPRVGTKNGLWIRTFDPTGKSADRGFHTIVQY